MFQFKLSLIAQSCLCPGFSTLFANIVGIRSAPDPDLATDDGDNWEFRYFQGCDYDVYPAQLSSAFIEKKFPEVVEWVTV